MGMVFNAKILIYHSRANLDLKILYGAITDLLDPEMGKENFTVSSGP